MRDDALPVGNPDTAQRDVVAGAEGMDVEWMTDKHEIAQAIPPAYAEFLGKAAITQLDGAQEV